ncbi:(2Fe-2S)-binding protein [uncultured Thiohalocapsa sp.]|mgnify:CR=1 FL=1|jgi:aerobic-type carbon monoxide dehydrogenase small subunit (CoxS/CutS family)|uniref:(2Fe-2S)-binding protein n=1 Tax=uncultured Thiohalocapsa sp. TaxID=768990 RepID=UPI0025DA9A3A|nr:(2Fe-2S)-binding protein [uncultured Thiohalocapsa sp.]
MIDLTVNQARRELDLPGDTPLLWALRDRLGLTGTKFGCGIGSCGACIVHLDGDPVNACMTSLSAAAGKSVTTIEGLNDDIALALRSAWISEQVPQCGYCQPGQIMAAAALLARHPRPTDAQITAAMDRVLCRCGTYNRVRRAIHRAASPTLEAT